MCYGRKSPIAIHQFNSFEATKSDALPDQVRFFTCNHIASSKIKYEKRCSSNSKKRAFS